MKYKNNNNYKGIVNTDRQKIYTLYKSILVGLAAGVVITAYRVVLMKAEELSFHLYGYFKGHLVLIPLLFLALGIMGYFTGCLVSRFPMIGGSGIPQVKGIIMGYFKNNWFGTLLAKFFGGAVSILAGLSLGREGPSIQLGACVAEGVGGKLASTRQEKKILIASGASAGLAAAFNAPLAGAMFALEEIFKYFSPVILLSTMVSAVIADYISKIVFGLRPVFAFEINGAIGLKEYWLLLILGVFLGFAGALYNYTLLLSQRIYKRIKWLNKKNRAMIPFILAGILGLIYPLVLGGGHIAIPKIELSSGIAFLIILLVVKFLFSMISFGSGAPGGIFFPLLVMGAILGGIFGDISIRVFGLDPGLYNNFIILAMVGFFTAIVRAPITGVILLIEMTGSFAHLLPLTVVAISSYITADLLKSEPVYESLLENQINEKGINTVQIDSSKKITFEIVVHHGSAAENQCIKDIDLPDSCLLVAVKRNQKEFIPKGNTRLLPGDYLVLLTSASKEAITREKIVSLTTH